MKKRTITLYGLRQMKSSLEDSVDVLQETVRAATVLRRPVAGFTQRSSLGRAANSAKQCDGMLIVAAQLRGHSVRSQCELGTLSALPRSLWFSAGQFRFDRK